MTNEIVLEIAPALWHTSNDRLHWAVKAKKTKHIRALAQLEARRAKLTPVRTVHVCAWIGYPTRSKADPSNAAPVVKAALDGLTDAGIWTDDDSDHVIAVEYRRDATTKRRGLHTVRLTLTEQTIPWGGPGNDAA